MIRAGTTSDRMVKQIFLLLSSFSVAASSAVAGAGRTRSRAIVYVRGACAVVAMVRRTAVNRGQLRAGRWYSKIIMHQLVYSFFYNDRVFPIYHCRRW
jgi:hypothetical protein